MIEIDWRDKILDAVTNHKSLERDGYLIVNSIGSTIYIAFELLERDELDYLIREYFYTEEED